jgi:predicted kinase
VPREPPTLTLTRGLPASGKTTWARAQAGAVRVNRDDLRRMLHGAATHEGRAEVMVTVAQRAQLDALLRAGADVICDDTNLRSRVLRELAEMGLACGARVVLRDFTDVPVEECIARDAARDPASRVGEAVIRGMYDRYLAGKSLPLPVPSFELPPASVYVPPDGTPSAVLVDIDGTVATMDGRSPYDMARVAEDVPNAPVVEAVRAMHAAGHLVVFCSGRSEDARGATTDWLAEHVGVPYAALHMRPMGDQRRDAVVKQEIFEREIRDRYRILCVFDDRAQVVRMWRSLGLPVFQVAEGLF